MTTDIFAPYEIAKQLKEFGFDEPCMGYYAMIDEEDEENEEDIRLFIEVNYCSSTNIINISDDCDFYNYNTTDYISAPTWEQVFKWFREKGYFFYILQTEDLLEYWEEIEEKGENKYSGVFAKTYEQARENLALKLIELYGQRTNKK